MTPPEKEKNGGMDLVLYRLGELKEGQGRNAVRHEKTQGAIHEINLVLATKADKAELNKVKGIHGIISAAVVGLGALWAYFLKRGAG